MKKLVLILSLILTSLATFALPATTDTPQGAIWNLQARGILEEAEQLEEHLRQVLESDPIVLVKELSRDADAVRGGVSKSYLVQFQNNVVAVMKEDDPDERFVALNTHRYEVAAYIIDKILGLNLIPLTVSRSVEGVNYSLQLYYNSKPLESSDLAKTDFHYRLNDLILLDQLIQNSDRNLEELHNMVLGEDGRLIAIDHARSFVKGVDHVYLPNHIAEKVSLELRERILMVDESVFSLALKNHLNDDELREFLSRLQHIKKILQAVPAQGLSLKKTDRPQEPLPKKWSFRLDKNILEIKFLDLFYLKSAFGEKAEDLAKVQGAFQKIDNRAAQRYVYKLIKGNWDKWNHNVKAIVAQELASGSFDNFLLADQDMPKKIVTDFPQLAEKLLKNERLRVSIIYSVLEGLRHQSDNINSEVRAIVIRYFIDNEPKLGLPLDIEGLIGDEFTRGKALFLKELYAELKKENLQGKAFEIFRMRERTKKDLTLQLLASVESEHVAELKGIIEAGYIKLAGQGVANSVHFVEAMPMGPLMCSRILLK